MQAGREFSDNVGTCAHLVQWVELDSHKLMPISQQEVHIWDCQLMAR